MAIGISTFVVKAREPYSGHAADNVVAKVLEQLRRGSSFGIATPYEKELAEIIIRHLPGMDKLRFVSSGTEATMTAIRLARAFTGKSRIVQSPTATITAIPTVF